MALLKPAAVALGLALCAGAAQAHIGADPGEAAAGGYQPVRFRVGHGCSEAEATTALRIAVPPSVVSVKAQPKPGWTLAFERDPKTPGKIAAVTWRGRLAPDEFDEFALFLHLPPEAGTLYFPAVQTCGASVVRWDEIPAGGESARPAHPAPALRLVPAASPEHHH
jgi:uncharacterized protein YcnI